MRMKYQIENFNGELDFRSRFHKGWYMETHLHEYSEVLYCKAGGGQVTVNGTALYLGAGQFIWLMPNDVHQYDFREAELVCAVFSNDLIPLFFKAVAGKRPQPAPIEAGELAPLLEGLYTLKKENYLQLSGHLNLIAARVRECAQWVKAGQGDAGLYQKVVTYLAEHYTEDITLAGIARRFGYHEKYLSHTLCELTGISFKRLLANYRVNHAKRLLEQEKNISITTVAMQSGFSAINTFHRSFKELVGMTPLAYRKSFAK